MTKKGIVPMNTTQIKCFLALAETLNYTRAAARLYLSQPGLSRQINSIEQELNTQLFIRNQRNVRLTPAGALLAEKLRPMMENYEQVIDQVQTVGRGYTGVLDIGLLEGQRLDTEIVDLFYSFMQQYPNISLQICQGSFGDLRRQLHSGKLDIIFTIHFDVMDEADVETYAHGDETEKAYFAISKKLPIAQQECITPEELVKETMLIISPEDSRMGAEMTTEFFKSKGLMSFNTRYAPNLPTLALWIEAGLGFGIINGHTNVAANPSVRLIPEIPLNEAYSCAAWLRGNENPALALFLEMLKRQ